MNVLEEKSDEFLQFVEQFEGFRKACAESIIGQGRVVAKASEKLTEAGLTAFCERANLPKNSSTFRKYRAIGENAERLLPVAHKLPNNWTTVHKLSTLRPEVFEFLLNEDRIHPLVTANEIRAALSNARPHVEKCVFRVDATALTAEKRGSCYSAIKKLADQFGVTITGPNDLIEGHAMAEVA